MPDTRQVFADPDYHERWRDARRRGGEPPVAAELDVVEKDAVIDGQTVRRRVTAEQADAYDAIRAEARARAEGADEQQIAEATRQARRAVQRAELERAAALLPVLDAEES